MKFCIIYITLKKFIAISLLTFQCNRYMADGPPMMFLHQDRVSLFFFMHAQIWYQVCVKNDFMSQNHACEANN